MDRFTNDKFTVIDFEIVNMDYSGYYNLFAILDEAVEGRKKGGRKALTTNRVLIRSDLSREKAGELLARYRMYLEFVRDMKRLEKMLSVEDLEIDGDSRGTFIGGGLF